jgi:hypothetical protein
LDGTLTQKAAAEKLKQSVNFFLRQVWTIRVLEKDLRPPNRQGRFILSIEEMFLQCWDAIRTVHAVDESAIVKIFNAVFNKALSK